MTASPQTLLGLYLPSQAGLKALSLSSRGLPYQALYRISSRTQARIGGLPKIGRMEKEF